MAYSQRQNALKTKRQLQDKLQQVKQLQTKFQQMDTKMTHKAYEKVNTVMLRNVQIKHTSEFMIKLSDEFFAQVKTHTALEYLGRKAKGYEQELKKVNLKIEVMDERSNYKNKNSKEQQLNKKYPQSTVQSIGKNEQGEEIFNIIELDQQPSTQPPKPSKSKKQTTTKHNNNQNDTKTKQTPVVIKKEQAQNQTQPQPKPTQKPNNTKIQDKQSSSVQQSEQGGDLLINRGDYSSGQSSLDQIQQQQDNHDLDTKLSTEEKPQNKNQSNSALNPSPTAASISKNQPETINQQKAKKVESKPQQKTQNSSSKIQSKSKQQSKTSIQEIQLPQQPAKSISRFKLQRMKQKLQSSIQ